MAIKKTMVVLAGGVVVAFGLISLLNRPSAVMTSVPAADLDRTPSGVAVWGPASSEPASTETPSADPVITTEQFEQMSPQDQDQAVTAFIAAFWQSESPASTEAAAQDRYLSLELFEQPYMRSITEEEFQRLSPEEQQKAISDITESCRQTRTQVLDVIAQARAAGQNGSLMMSEAYLISALETGRELTASKDGMLITRITGIACQKAALKELVGLYTTAGDRSKSQVMQDHLRDLDTEAGEIRSTARAAGR